MPNQTPAPPTAPPPGPAPYNEGYFAPTPTPLTRAMRTFLPWQLWRFAVINVRMLVMIAKSHD